MWLGMLLSERVDIYPERTPYPAALAFLSLAVGLAWPLCVLAHRNIPLESASLQGSQSILNLPVVGRHEHGWHGFQEKAIIAASNSTLPRVIPRLRQA